MSTANFGKVGVLFGGSSSEREVSMMSGNGVLSALRARSVNAHAFDPATQSLGELESLCAAMAARRDDRATLSGGRRGMELGVPASPSADRWPLAERCETDSHRRRTG